METKKRNRTYYRCLAENNNKERFFKVFGNSKEVFDWVNSHDFVSTRFWELIKQGSTTISLKPITYEKIIERMGVIGFQPKGK